MNTAVASALVVLGVYLSMRTLAALYRVLDLWYTIGTVWPRVARAIFGWAAGTTAIAWLLPARLRAPFLWGFAGYPLFYVAVALCLSRVVMPRIAARVGRATQEAASPLITPSSRTRAAARSGASAAR